MPIKPLRPCNQPGCAALTRLKYCDKHQHIEQEKQVNRHKYYDKHQRDKKMSAFYKSVEWVRVRLQVLTRDNFLCQHCLKEKRITHADMVHHIKPLRLFWHLRLVLINLISLCNSCHAKIDHDKLC